MPSTLSGPTNGRRLRSCVIETLIPVQHPGDIVVMDNLPAHRVAGVREVIEAAGVRLLYLPFHRSGFKPIERVFAKLKALLRSAATRTIPNLWAAIQQAFRRRSAATTSPQPATRTARLSLPDRSSFNATR